MKKTKLYAKKTLSVLMAVMMLMSAWVFVAPEKASATAAATVAGDNTVALNSIPSFDTNVTTIHGSFESDSDYLETQYYDAIYKNVLYTDGPVSIAASATSSKTEYGSSWTGSNGVTLYWYHATATVMYDGETTPSLGVCVNPVMYYTGTWSRKSVNRLSWIESGGNGFTINENWHGSDGRLNFQWMWHGQSAMMGYDKNDTGNTSMFQTLSGNSDNHFYANLLKFTGSMSDTEFWRSAQPYFGFYGDNGDNGKKIYAQSGDTLYVINYKPLKAALNEALGTGTYSISTLKASPAKYTNASVAEYVAAVKDLIAAKPNNYVNNTKNDYTGYANAASAAVTRFNNAKANLTLQTYTVTFKDVDGNIDGTYPYNYGTTVNLAELAADCGNTIRHYNAAQHQTYTWGNLGTQTITDDLTINETPSGLENHSYGAYTQTADEHSRTCSVCNYVQTDRHTKDSGTVDREETCTVNGIKTYDCAVCGKTDIETEVIDNITGHDFDGTPVENVTGETGENGTHWRKCSRCDAYGWSGVENNCEKHNWDKNSDGEVNAEDADATLSKASTCKEAGYEIYTCKVCSAKWTKTLPLAEHKIIATAKKDVTTICGGDGNAAFWSCSVCNRVWKDVALTDELTDTTDADNDGIPDALETKGPEHNFNGAYASKTPGKDGTHYRQCERFTQCKTYGAEEPHTWGEPKVTDASCEKEGKKVYTCTLCPEQYEVTLAKLNHDMTKHDRVEAKCDVAGSIEYYSCSICKKNYTDENGTTVVTNTSIPALNHKCTGHHEGDELVTKATCTAEAVYKNTCDYCGKEVSGTHEYGDVDLVNGHNYSGDIKADAENKKHAYLCKNGCDTYGNETDCVYVKITETDSTCKTKGYITYQCTTCENGYTTEKDLDPENHEGETEVRDAAAATCKTPGYTGDTYCLDCDKIESAGIAIPVDKTNHENMKVYDQVNSTCQTEGYRTYKYCDKCDTYEIAKETIAKKNHSFTKYTTNNNGTHTAKCDTCKAENGEVATDTKDCTGGTANCQYAAICTVCKAPYGQIDENTHVNQEFVAKTLATCQKEGHEAYYKCADCGKTIGEIETLPVIDHTFGKWTKVEGEDKHTRSCTTCDPAVAAVATEEADCNGGVAYCNALAVCKDCKSEYGTFDAANHSTEANHLDGAYEATCQKEGFSGNYLYDCCNAVKVAGTTIEKKAHVYDVEVEGSRKAATCIAEGEVIFSCSTCDPTVADAATNKVILPIDSKNHASTETTVVGQKAATCEEDGHTGDIYYVCCYDSEKTDAENRKALKEKGTTIKANGQHVYGEAIPEYMAVIKEADGVKTLTKKDAEPGYAEKIAARRADNKWYHFTQCTICGTITEGACYTYAHTYNCVDTDKCVVCKGLCSLIDENVHANIIKIEGKDATHTEDGHKAYYQCADCKKYFLDDAGKKGFDPESEEGKKLIAISKDTVPCTEWEEKPFEVKPATCLEDGYKKYRCTTEGCTRIKTEVIPAAGTAHTWSEEYKEIKAATCGEVGYKAIYCSVCDTMKPNSAVTISATGEHNYILNPDKTIPGTSCKDPTVKFYDCSVCGDTKTETVYEGTADHEWSSWVTVGGDCSTGVVLERTCLACGAKEQQTISEGEHNYVVFVRVEPTPEKDGYVIYECENCKVRTEPEILKYEGPEAPDEHLVDYTQYRVVSEKTCTLAEQREYTCIRCGEKVVYSYGELADHYWLEQPAEIATCERDGHNAYYRCVICLEERGKEVYPATGHADNDNDGKCDECNSAFYNGGNSQCGCMCHKEGWFMQLIYKIVNFFWKLFKINPSCACGAKHY